MLTTSTRTGAPGRKEKDACPSERSIQQLLANLGVSICINAESSRPDYTTKQWKYLSQNWAQYTYEGAFDNPHTVCIVGWDDDYPKENFIEGHQPAKDIHLNTEVITDSHSRNR